MSLKWKTKILLAKIEAAYGTDATPTGGANAIYAIDVDLKPMEGEDLSRDLETPWMGAQETLPVGLHSVISFKVELAPSGTAGTAPAWGPLLRACGLAETISAGASVTYNPVTDGHESATIYLAIAGTRYVLLGDRGTVRLAYTAQKIPYLEFTFTGLFTQPAEVVRPTPDLTAFQKPQAVTKANTPTFSIDGVDLVMQTATLDLGNQVEKRFKVNLEEIQITDRSEMFQTTVDAVALTTLNPFALAAGSDKVAVSLVHGTGAGKVASLSIPNAQMQRPEGLANSQGVKEWPLKLVPVPDAGNDQWTLTLT